MKSDATLLFMAATTEAIAFGRRLKELRKRRGLNQKELAAAITVHQFQVSKYETGNCFPTVGKLLEIAKILQVNMDQLFGDVVPADTQVKNLRLLRRFKELENLPKDDQDTAAKLIDALIAKGKIRRIVA